MSRGVSWSARPTFAAFLMLAAGLAAGCTGDEVTPKSTNPGQVAFDDPNAILIQGIVVNDELAPLVDAIVTLTPSDQSTTTDDGGAFTFAVLQPGEYVISALLDRHEEASLSVSVPAAGLSGIEVRLLPTAEGIPYHETQTFVSYAFCHGPIGGGCFLVNTITSTNTLPEDRPDFAYEIPANGFEELRFEAQWSSPPTAGEGGFIARNREGLFLGCNNTQGADRPGGAPTIHYYENNNPDMEFDDDGDPTVDREASPVQMWIKAGKINNQVGGCVPMPQEKGFPIWQTVRISGADPHPFALNTRVELFLTFFYWRDAEDRSFTALEI